MKLLETFQSCNYQCGGHLGDANKTAQLDWDNIDLFMLVQNPEALPETQWSAWSDCSNSCGMGTKTRSSKAGEVRI